MFYFHTTFPSDFYQYDVIDDVYLLFYNILIMVINSEGKLYQLVVPTSRIV